MNDRLPALIEATKEYAMMAQTNHAPKEMTILPNQQDPLLWNGLWFVHEGQLEKTCPSYLLILRQNRAV